MIDFSKIHRFSFFYLIYKLLTTISLKVFYSEIHVLNKNRIPKNAAIIFAPNHQNAVMDALVILINLKSRTYFLARADLFAKKILAKILRFMCIIPVFRIRDGYSNLNQNDQIFNLCLRLLKLKKPLAIMPEGNHEGFRRLRVLKKGIPRIAFYFAQLAKYKEPIYIVPVGVDFSHYWHIGAQVVVDFGEPIDVLAYQQTYENNPAQAYNLLNAKIFDNLRVRMIHIESVDFYDTIDHLRKIGAESVCKILGLSPNYRPAMLEAQKQIVGKLDTLALSNKDEMQFITEKLNEYNLTLKKTKLRNAIINEKPKSIFKLCLSAFYFMLGVPFFILGFLFGYLVYRLPTLAYAKIKDVQFWSSVGFVLGMLLAVFLLTVYFLFLYIYFHSILIAFYLTALIFIFSVFALKYQVRFKIFWSSLRFRFMLSNKQKDVLQLLYLKSILVDFVETKFKIN